MAREEIILHLKPGEKQRRREGVIPDALKVKCGCFVSIYLDEKLRGCIGTFSEDVALHKNIKRMALAAASHDSRFSPIRAEETDRLKIEISVLTPRLPIRGPDEIIIGQHGIYMEQGSNRGTFLPQVAVNQQWSVEEFLGNCAKHKAGLGWDGWKTARLFTYEATVFDSQVEEEDDDIS